YGFRMEINGVPLHPLVIHATVVLTPLAGVLAVLYGVVPRWRWFTRWPFVFAALVGAGVTWYSAETGDDLKDQLGLHSNLMETHQMWAGRLQLAMWVLAAVTLVAAYVMPFINPLARGTDKGARIGVLSKPLVVLLPVVGIVVIVFVIFTGDAGARLVWAGGVNTQAA
ncbi:MAG: DUF2231 domain-containing protein, partial [Marmoricola sp.]